MSDEPKPTEVQRRRWMAQWRHAAVALARVNAEELARVDMRMVAVQLEDACRGAIRAKPPEPWSGLVEQQRVLHSTGAR